MTFPRGVSNIISEYINLPLPCIFELSSTIYFLGQDTLYANIRIVTLSISDKKRLKIKYDKSRWFYEFDKMYRTTLDWVRDEIPLH